MKEWLNYYGWYVVYALLFFILGYMITFIIVGVLST